MIKSNIFFKLFFSFLFTLISYSSFSQNVEFEKDFFKEKKEELKVAKNNIEEGDVYYLQGSVYYKQAIDFYLKANNFNLQTNLSLDKVNSIFLSLWYIESIFFQILCIQSFQLNYKLPANS